MRRFGVITAAFTLMMTGASVAAAQDAPKAGLTLATGATVGVHVPVGDRAAIRLELGFGRSTTEYEGSQFINDSITSTTLAPGVSGVFYVKSWEATRLYLSPQYSYARGTTSLNDDVNASHALAGMIGAEHRFGSRFAMYAEAGLGWSRSKTELSGGSPASSTTNTAFGTRSAVGGILFF